MEEPEIPFAFLDGDTFVLGVISIHETARDFPFRCSEFRTKQMDVMLVEAFLDSVKHGNSEPVNDEKQRLKLGAIVLDDCYRLHIASFWPFFV